MSDKKLKLDPTGLGGAREISQDRLSSVSSVKVVERSGSAVVRYNIGRDASGRMMIRSPKSDAVTRAVQKK